MSSNDDSKGHAQIPEAAGVGMSMEDADKEMEARHGPSSAHKMSPSDIIKKDRAKAQHMMELANKAKLGKDEVHTQDKSKDGN